MASDSSGDIPSLGWSIVAHDEVTKGSLWPISLRNTLTISATAGRTAWAPRSNCHTGNQVVPVPRQAKHRPGEYPLVQRLTCDVQKLGHRCRRPSFTNGRGPEDPPSDIPLDGLRAPCLPGWNTGGMDLDFVQLAYNGALSRLVADLPAELSPFSTIEIDFTDPHDLPYLFREGASVHRSSLWLTDDEEEATLDLAEKLQDDILDMLWGPVWPQCRRHTHPAVPRLVHGNAVWGCPTTGVTLAAIGSLRDL